MEFNNFSSASDHKAYGGRIGFQPCTNFDIGYGVQTSQVNADGFKGSPRALLQSVDLSSTFNALKGRWALQAQYAWSKIGSADYAPTFADDGTPFPTHFSSHRRGGYAQLSYRPRAWESEFANSLELVLRGDHMDAPNGLPGSFDEDRLTFGLDYWITSSVVLKTAYELDRRNNGEPNSNAFLLQIAAGL